MAVVELCDRMVSHLAPLLTAGRTKITIRHRNVGEWHWQSSGRAPHRDPVSPAGSQSSPGTSAPLALLSLTLRLSPHFLRTKCRSVGNISHTVTCKRIVRDLWAQETT